MKQYFIAALIAAASATSLLAQQTDATPGMATVGGMNAAAHVASLQSTDSLPSAPRPAAMEAVPFISVAAGFTYLQTDLTNTPGGAGGYLLGWYGIPELHVTKHISVIADFTNFSNYHAHSTENVHGFTGGPVYSLSPIKGVTPFGFVEGGAVRDSKDGAINWDPAAVGGVGFNVKLTHAVAFQVIPGEYVATKLPNGNWQSNFNTKAGFVFTSFRLKSHKAKS